METKKPKKYIMLDIETLGTEINSTIIQVSAIAFDLETNNTVEFNEFINISEMKIDVTGATLKWWLKKDAKLLTEILNKGKYSENHVLIKLYDWLKLLEKEDELFLCSNGINFDARIVKHKLENIGFDYPINFKNEIDFRTILWMFCEKYDVTAKEVYAKFKNTNYTPHNGLDDCRFQIDIFRHCYSKLTFVKENKSLI